MNLRIYNNGVTLIELIVSMVLVSAIIMTGLSMEFGLRRIYSTADMEVELLDEAAPIMMMVARDINKGVGSAANGQSPFQYNFFLGRYRIYYDSNSNGLRDAADTAVEYRSSGSWLGYKRDFTLANYVELSNRVVDFRIGLPINGTSSFSIILRRDPGAAVSYTNQEISLNSSAQFRGFSVN